MEYKVLETEGHPSCLRQIALFDNLLEAQIRLLAKAVYSRSYKRGEFVFQEGDRSDALYVVSQGVVKIAKVSATGREHVLRFLFQGDFGGLSSIFKGGVAYASAEVVEEAVVCRIYRKDLKTILDRNSDLAYRLLQLPLH